MKRVALLMVIGLLLAGCGGDAPATTKYENLEMGVTAELPAGAWDFDKDISIGNYRMFSSISKDKSYIFEVYKVDSTGAPTEDELAEDIVFWEEGIKNGLTPSISVEDVEFHGYKGKRLEGQQESAGLDCHQITYLFTAGGRVRGVTVCVATTLWESGGKETAQRIFDSVQIRAAEATATTGSASPKAVPITSQTQLRTQDIELSEKVTDFEALDLVAYKEDEELFDDSSLKVMGTLRHKGTDARMVPKIMANFLDAEGKVLASEQIFDAPNYIRPGSTIPFYWTSYDFLSDIPDTWTKIEIEIETREFSGELADMLYADFQIEEPTLKPSRDGEHGQTVTGRVRNTGTSGAFNVRILGVLYDREGRILDVEQTHAKDIVIAPGNDSRFELEFRTGVEGATFEFCVDSYKDE